MNNLKFSHVTGFPARRVYTCDSYREAKNFRIKFDGMMMKGGKTNYIIII